MDALVQSAVQTVINTGQQQGQPQAQQSGRPQNQAYQPPVIQQHYHQYAGQQRNEQQSEEPATVVYNTQVTEVNINASAEYNTGIAETVDINNSYVDQSSYTLVDNNTLVEDTDVVSISDSGMDGWGAAAGYDGSGWGDEVYEYDEY